MKIEEIIIGFSRVILLGVSILGFLGWLYLVIFSLSYSGWPRNFGEIFLTFFPLIYFALTIYGCAWVKVKRNLIGLGITLNLLLALFIAQLIIETGEFGPGAVIGIALIGVWSLLCLGYAWFRPPTI